MQTCVANSEHKHSEIECFSVKPKNRPGPARPGHAKIALYTTAVEFDQFSLYSTGTMARYDRLSL